MSDQMTIALTVCICGAMTMLTRGLPYLLFGGKRELPPIITYLGKVLPAAIMVILVMYCLRGIDVTVYPLGLAELIAVSVIILLQVWKKNTIASIVAGTALYMILMRVL